MRRLIASAIVSALFAVPLQAQDIPLSQILVENEGWREVAKGVPKVTYLEAERNGLVGIFNNERTHLLKPGDVLEKLSLPRFATPRKDQSNAKTRGGASYEIDKDKKTVEVAIGKKRTPLKLPGLVAPSCLTLWPDEGHLVIGESGDAYLWAVRIEKDGTLGPGDRYYSLRIRKGVKLPVTAMTMDAGFLLYACTPLGVQVFDPTGRLSGVIAAPSKDTMTAITIGGEKASTLFVAAGDKIFARRIQGRAVYTLKKKG